MSKTKNSYIIYVAVSLNIYFLKLSSSKKGFEKIESIYENNIKNTPEKCQQ
jgi:hypothetical protein